MMKAVYAGTFDPITYGHIDVIERAAKIFDEVVVAVAENKQKSPLLTLEKRVELTRQVISATNITVEPFTGLLVDFVAEKNISVILRGLRAVSDFDYEFQLASMNHKLAPQIETLFIPAAERSAFLSSSLVREILAMKGDIACFVPPQVIKVFDSLDSNK